MININKTNFLHIDEAFVKEKGSSNTTDLVKIVQALRNGDGATITIDPEINPKELKGFFRVLHEFLGMAEMGTLSNIEALLGRVMSLPGGEDALMKHVEGNPEIANAMGHVLKALDARNFKLTNEVCEKKHDTEMQKKFTDFGNSLVKTGGHLCVEEGIPANELAGFFKMLSDIAAEHAMLATMPQGLADALRRMAEKFGVDLEVEDGSS